MPHSALLTWQETEDNVENVCKQVLTVLDRAEALYQDLLEAYSYNGGTDVEMAKTLFATDTPSPVQQQMVTDLRLTSQALHQVYLALHNGTIAKEDRAVLLHRFS